MLLIFYIFIHVLYFIVYHIVGFLARLGTKALIRGSHRNKDPILLLTSSQLKLDKDDEELSEESEK